MILSDRLASFARNDTGAPQKVPVALKLPALISVDGRPRN